MKGDSPLYTFYSWNENLERDELYIQLNDFSKRGVKGVFLHARAGLSVPYFSEEWFAAVAYAVDTAKKLGMEVGIYDENGWPSGFGNGQVNGSGERYWQKKLRVENSYPKDPNVSLLASYKKSADGYVCCEQGDGELFAYIVKNPEYVDLLAPWVTDAFISCTHEVYREKFGSEFGKTIRYLFTDEPQLAAPYAYTEGLEDIFFREYGYDMRKELWRFAFVTEKFTQFHYDYRSLTYKLFHQNYTKKIAGWCERYGLRFTGHFACEENTVTINLNGGVMNGYEFMQTPGVDALGRRRPPEQLFEQLVSAKNIFGKADALSETFGCSGWGTTLADFKYYWANQAVRGVSLPCLHLSAYSMRGIRKRDYPAFFSYQEPWWDHFGELTRFMRSTGDFVRQDRYSDVLIVSPETSALGLTPECKIDKQLSDSYSVLIHSLVRCQVAFDIIGGILFDKYASVKDGEIKIRNRSYKTLILSSGEYFTPVTLGLIKAALEQNIPVALADDYYGALPSGVDRIFSSEESVKDYFWKTEYKRVIAAYDEYGEIDGDIVVRRYESGFAWFNGNRNALKHIRIYAEGADSLKVIGNDIEESVILTDGFADIDLQPGQLMLAENGVSDNCLQVVKSEFLNAENIVRSDRNALTLDKGRYSLNGKDFSQIIPVLDIEENLAKNSVSRAWVRYEFFIEYIPSDLCVAIETGAKQIKINGRLCELSKEWYVDKCIRLVQMSELAVPGKNTVDILYESRTDDVRSSVALDDENEIARNLFTYDLEIENIYVLGSFSVVVESYEYQKNMLYVRDSAFKIVKEIMLTQAELTPQGLWFYRGGISARIMLPKLEKGEYGFIRLTGGEECSAEIVYKDKTLGVLLSCDEILNVSGICGEYADLILTVSNRNLLGPHHHVTGEPSVVGGNTFRGVRGFEDEWLSSRYRRSTGTDGYYFRRNRFPQIQFIIKRKKER